MTTNCIFWKKCHVWTVTFLTISAYVLNAWKLDVCSVYLKEKQTENGKMLPQNNCINNGVTNGLK